MMIKVRQTGLLTGISVPSNAIQAILSLTRIWGPHITEKARYSMLLHHSDGQRAWATQMRNSSFGELVNLGESCSVRVEPQICNCHPRLANPPGRTSSVLSKCLHRQYWVLAF